MYESFFNPKSVAVIGASRDKSSAGYGVLKSLLKGGVFKSTTNQPFTGKIYPVNPKTKNIQGQKSYSSIKDIPGKADLGIICVPAKIVPIVLKDSIGKINSAVIISAGFSEIGNSELEKEILTIARNANIRIIGPNCLGVMRPSKKLNATFGPCMAYPGDIAFFSQSGALIDSIIDWSLEREYGFSTIVSMGNKSDIDIPDLLEWAAQDKETKAIALYIEGIKNGRKFLRIASKVSKLKPIVALKAGRFKTGMKAVSSHTGSLAGSYDVYKAAFKQSGVHIADNVDDLFEMAETLSIQPPCKKNNIAIITNGGGAGVLCADHCENLGINLAKLSQKTLNKLDNSGKMHPAYSRKNPLDLVGDALSDRYKIAIDAVLSQQNVYGLIVIQTLQTMTQPVLDAKAIIAARKKFPEKPIIASYMGGHYTKKAAQLLEDNNIPDFNVPYKAARAMKALIDRNNYKT